MYGITKDFNVRVHQGSAFRPYLFSVVIDEVTKEIQDEVVPRCMMFADDIVLVGTRKRSRS